MNTLRFGFLFLAAALVSLAADFRPPGHRPVPPGLHALTGGKVITKPGESLENATILIRDGLIEAVGVQVSIPPEARRWDMKGTVIYAGFLDPYLHLPGTAAGVSNSRVEPVVGSGAINFFGVAGQETDPGQPGPGSELSAITPQKRVVESYVPDAKNLESLRSLGFTAGNLIPTQGVFRGTSALVVLSETNPTLAVLRSDVFQHMALDTEAAREGSYPGSLMGVIAAIRQTFLDAAHYNETQKKSDSPSGRGAGYNPGLESLQDTLTGQRQVVFEPGNVLMVDRAARLAREFNLKPIILSSGQEWRRPDLAVVPGNAFIVPIDFPEAPKFPEEEDWEQVSLDQLRVWDWAPENAAFLRQQGVVVALTTFGLADRKQFKRNLRFAMERGLSETDALAGLTTIPARFTGVEKILGTIEPGKIANLTVVEGGTYFEEKSKVREVWIDGRIFRVEQQWTKAPEKPAAAPDEKKIARETELLQLRKTRVARAPQQDRQVGPQPEQVLVKNATLWTSGPQGKMEGADLLIQAGRIAAVGRGLSLPANSDKAVTIDAKGKHVTPGLIDAHSHSMILGGVNEGTIPSTAMVRIGDVVNSETENIHQQLAGGLTVANLLHGSANPIGGQNCVIKLREGASPEAMKLAGAPSGIKFALGENVKQANWGEKNVTRFPQTRLGVRTFMANRFVEAKQYLAALERHRSGQGPTPRPDLELAAIGEIIEGKRLIHCHSYRQDEILVFLRLMEEFGVKVATLQHVLEGYKVADEIARHGAGGSCFSDWWAYKFEVYDAIPYAGSLMRDRGVVVSFNSDSSDLARRMYLEAAKAVKYGGTEEVEALKFITLNPAIQLKIQDKVGSLEVGKDADFVLWSHSPLDSATVCQQTWIDGKKYFDIDQAPQRSSERAREWTALVQKAKKLADPAAVPGDAGEKARQAFFRVALEHRYDGMERHCED